MWGECGGKLWSEPREEVCLEAYSQGFGWACLETFIGQPAEAIRGVEGREAGAKAGWCMRKGSTAS